MDSGRSGDPIQNLQETYSRYKVYDQHYDEIGRVDDIFVDENDQPEYIGVKMGFLGLKSTIVPIDLVRVNDRRGLIEVAESKEVIKNAPSFDDDEEISPEHEAQIRNYYGLDRVSRGPESSYRGYAAGASPVDLEYGERAKTSGHSLAPGGETGERPASREVRDEDEVRVQRTEEELRAGVRQREAGSVNVRKRVHTDHERLRVPKRREQVSVERVPVEEDVPRDATGVVPEAESTGDEVRIPIVEEEVVVEKRPVVKEEIRIRKDLVEEEEVVEADVRKEEIEVDDETRRRDR
ncbi:MAG: PRC and DUF2382 domain-containing protein [Actinomycetota bacterium]|nr:PRC and DUF2382 domain-containing protein [Actinomycetota bacterium]